MKNIVHVASIAGLALTLTVAAPRVANAQHRVTVPTVPDTIHVDEGNRAFLVGHATGTQNYVCLPSGTGFKYVLFTPEATLFRDNDRQVITHFFSPSPEAGSPIRPTWQHSRDSSVVWAKATGMSTDANFVAQGAIPWVRLESVGSKEGPTGGDALTETTFIQRINTYGGSAPATGCASATDVGAQAFVPYTADYVFYTKAS